MLAQISTHTLTWSVTAEVAKYAVKPGDFNSHAHVERDAPPYRDYRQASISTHTLTWSVTGAISAGLTGVKDFNSHAHVERDLVVIFVLLFLFHFNSHAHVERDITELSPDKTFCISTHTLTWSVTILIFYSEYTIKISTHTLTWSVTSERLVHRTPLLVFQLTRSRGA